MTLLFSKVTHGYESETILWDPSWEYASYSVIHTGTAVLYHTEEAEAKHRTVCINAGHGTSGGSSVLTLCHPDGSAKVTGGTTEEEAIYAPAVSSGMTFEDGTPEASVTLELARCVANILLSAGYDVLMVRDAEDVQLDNVARTVMANQLADCHVALHYDSTDTDKGVFFLSVPSDPVYRSMEPVASHWQEHNRLGSLLTEGIAAQGFSLYAGGSLEMDLTQTSYSTIPSVDLEVGDKGSTHQTDVYNALAEGILRGIESYW